MISLLTIVLLSCPAAHTIGQVYVQTAMLNFCLFFELCKLCNIKKIIIFSPAWVLVICSRLISLSLSSLHICLS